MAAKKRVRRGAHDEQNPVSLKKILFLGFSTVILISFFLLLGSVFFKSANAATSISFIQASASSATTKATSKNISFTKAVKQGDLLVGLFAQSNASGQVKVSDNVNGAWTRGGSEKFSNGAGDIALFYKTNSKASSTGITITASASASTYLSYGVSEYSGIATTSALDRSFIS